MKFLHFALIFCIISCSNKSEPVVKIAFIGPLTGGVSSNGLGGRNSAELAVYLHNKKKDKRYKYSLVPLDDECKPNVGVQVATKAASDSSIIAAITHYCSAVAMSTVDIFHKFSLPVIVWGAVLPEITYGNNYKEIHRVNGTMINQNETAAKFMLEKGYKTWVIIHDTTDYGNGHNKYFSKALLENGGMILGTFGVTSDQQDFNAELTKIKSLDPDVIYFGGITPIGVRIKTQMKRVGLNAVFQGTSGILSDAFIEGLCDLSEGVLSFREGEKVEDLPGGEFFIKSYKDQGFKDPPEAYGPFAFVATNIIIDTIEKNGPNRDAVKEAINNIKDFDSIVGKISFDEYGQNTVPLISKFVVENKKWIKWEDSKLFSKFRKDKKNDLLK